MLFLHLNFFINFSSVSPLSSFSSCLRVHPGAIFSMFFFCLRLEGGSGPLKFFFGGLQGAAWGPKVCEGCRFFAFVRVVVDIDFGPPKPPKSGPLNFFLKVLFDFSASQKFLKKLCPQDGRPKIVKIGQNRILEATQLRTSSWNPFWIHLGPILDPFWTVFGPKTIKMLKTQ